MEAEEKETTSATRNLGIKAAKGTLTYVIGNIIGSLAVLLLLIILARLLTPSDFGLYAIAIAFYNILSGHFIFGTVLRKDLPKMQDDREKAAELISNTYFVAFMVAIAISVIAFLFSNAIAVSIYHNAAFTSSLQLAALLVFLYALFNLLLATLIAVDKVKEGTVMYLLYAFIQLFASVGLVLAGYGVFGAVIGLGLGLIIPSLLGLYWVMRHIKGRLVKPSRKVMRYVVGFSTPVLASSVAQQGPPNLAILLLGVYAATAVVGNYNAAFRFGNFVNVILVSIGFVLLPAFSKAFSDKDLSSKIDKIYNSSIYYTLLLLLPFVIYTVSVAHPLLYLLFSSKYPLAPFYFALIAIGSTIGMINTYAGNLQVSYGDTRLFMYYQLLAVSIQVVLLLVLTPLFGAIGAILGLFVISQILIDIIYVYALYRQFKLKHRFGKVIRLIIPSILLLLLLYFFTGFLHNSKWSLVTNLVATILLFPPLAVLFGGIKRENVDFIKDIAKSFRSGPIGNYLIRYVELFTGTKKD